MLLRRLVDFEKAISSPVRWTEPDNEDGYVRFLVALEVEGVTEASLQLSGGTYIYYPDEHVTFELSIFGINSQRRTRLMRLDWRSLKGGHTNVRCSGEWAGKRLPSTHLHSFDLNYGEAKGVMRRGKLPCAEPVDPEPKSFEELRERTGLLFRIKNMDIVPRPEWVYSLFGKGE
jgi:hypothetical protein